MDFFAKLYYNIKPWLVSEHGNFLYDYYYPLTGHPYNIIVPMLISLALVLLAWRISGRKFFSKCIKNKSRFAPLIRYVFANIIYLMLAMIFCIVLALIIGHFSPFWIVSFTFYGLQVIFPVFLLVLSVRLFREKSALPSAIAAVLALAILAVSGYATFIEPFNIEVTQHQYEFKDNKDLKLRIVLISDIQTDVLSSREKHLVEIVKGLKPDVILLAGDYFNGNYKIHHKGFQSARYVMENLNAPYGIYAVSSDSNTLASHEPLFAGLDITYLENLSQKITINGKDLYIVGVSRRVPEVEIAWNNVPEEAAVILLHHSPDAYFWKATDHYHPDLILAGHTHGGQISLPLFGPLTSGTRYGREYAKGWFSKILPSKEEVSMYVTRGIGLEGNWAPKIRFFSRPEVTVIDVGGE